MTMQLMWASIYLTSSERLLLLWSFFFMNKRVSLETVRAKANRSDLFIKVNGQPLIPVPQVLPSV